MSVVVHASQPSPVMLQPAGLPSELTAEQLHFHPALTLDFRTTEELESLRDFTGQTLDRKDEANR